MIYVHIQLRCGPIKGGSRAGKIYGAECVTASFTQRGSSPCIADIVPTDIYSKNQRALIYYQTERPRMLIYKN